MPHDISKGSLVAYLIKKDDPNIYDPVSRILLKPFENENGDCIYEFGKVYETYSPLFINKVAEIAKSISSDKNGLFTMRSDIYGDGLERTKSINLESIKNAEESNLNKPEKRIRNFISSMMR